MSRSKLEHRDPHHNRQQLQEAVDLGWQMLAFEALLIEKLKQIDEDRVYVWIGSNSLSAFCCKALKISRTQTQSIVTRVRRAVPTAQLLPEEIAAASPSAVEVIRHRGGP